MSRLSMQRMGFKQGLGILLCAHLLSGCVPVALVSVSALTGYTIGKDQRNTTQQIHDADVNARVNSAYFAAPDINAFAIQVRVYEGIVTLTGEVPSQGVAQRAIQMAQHTRGVQGVVSRLIIVAPER